MASAPITAGKIEGEKVEVVTDFLFLGYKITADGDCSHEIRRLLLLGRKAMTNLDSMLKSKNIYYSANKCLYSQGYDLPSDHIQLRERDHKESRVPKNWYFQTVVLGNTLESPLESKGFKQINLKGNQPWKLITRTDAEVETPVFWSSDMNSWLIGKVPEWDFLWGGFVHCLLYSIVDLLPLFFRHTVHKFLSLEYLLPPLHIHQFSSVTQSCLTLCHPWTAAPGFPVHHQLPELAQTHVHRVGDIIQSSHTLLSLSPPAFNLSYHQGLFQWASFSHQVAKVLELQLQHQSS